MASVFGEVLLVRHASTAWSRSGRHTSHTDLGLDEAGREAARRLAPVLSSPPPPTLVLCSPLRRARETGELAGLGRIMQFDDALVEWDYGDYEGRTTAEIRAERPGWSLFRDGAPGGETLGEVAARADRVVARLQATAGRSIVVAHGHLLRVLGPRWLGLSPDLGEHLALDAGSVSVLDHEREVPVIRSWNGTVG